MIQNKDYKKCPYCGTLNYFTAKSCVSCGRLLPENTAYPFAPVAQQQSAYSYKPASTTATIPAAQSNFIFSEPWIVVNAKKNIFHFKTEITRLFILFLVLPFLSLIFILLPSYIYIDILFSLITGGAGTALLIFINKNGKKHFNNAVGFMSNMQYVEAVNELNLSYKLGYNPIASLYNLSVCYKHMENSTEAINKIGMLLNLDPTNALAWSLKGDLLASRFPSDALIAYQNSLKYNPKNPISWNNMGMCLELLGRRNDALICYNNATKIFPSFKEAWLNKGNVSYMLGLKHEGDAAYEYTSKL